MAASLQNTLLPAAKKLTMIGVKPIWQTEFALAHAQTLARSFKHLTQRDLLPGEADPAKLSEQLYGAPFVLVSHGTQTDPILNYGNRAALALWEMTWDEFTRTPSRLTAEAPNREERARLLAAVTARGFIDDYAGVRISKTGRRFEISQATVWNLVSLDRTFYGQAAMFREWRFL
ncbi:MAG: MEKHLA domain-containing protein [Verrucomicrobiota bacterium]